MEAVGSKGGGVHFHLPPAPETAPDDDDDDEEELDPLAELFARFGEKGRIQIWRRNNDTGREVYAGQLTWSDELAADFHQRIAERFRGGSYSIVGFTTQAGKRERCIGRIPLEIDADAFPVKPPDPPAPAPAVPPYPTPAGGLGAADVATIVRQELAAARAADPAALYQPVINLLATQADRSHALLQTALTARPAPSATSAAAPAAGAAPPAKPPVKLPAGAVHVTSAAQIEQLRSKYKGGGAAPAVREQKK
jgi:hypothetical protein